jgi:hypothetical protein
VPLPRLRLAGSGYREPSLAGICSSKIATALDGAADFCEQTLSDYLAENPEAATSLFCRRVRFAAAATKTASRELLRRAPENHLSIFIAETLLRDAAEAGREQHLDDDVAAIIAECDKAARTCAKLLQNRQQEET